MSCLVSFLDGARYGNVLVENLHTEYRSSRFYPYSFYITFAYQVKCTTL